MGARHGSVLVLALWVLAILGFLALAVGGHVSANVKIARYQILLGRHIVVGRVVRGLRSRQFRSRPGQVVGGGGSNNSGTDHDNVCCFHKKGSKVLGLRLRAQG